ncbi:MAG: DUF1109 family protein [Oligoflexus sp.]|nr:DUF1109 family protein [Oligoflexus sp.]
MQDDLFIKNLMRDFKPKVSVLPSQKPLMGWMVFTLLVLASAVTLHSIRDDMNVMLGKGSYYVELFSALSVGIIAAGSALTMRIPASRAPLKVLATVIAFWVASLIVHSLRMGPGQWTFNVHDEFACMASIFLFGTLPSLPLYFLVRHGATTEPKLTMALIAIAFTSAAAAFLPLACGNDGLVHLLFGHALALFVAGGMGFASGRQLLKW